MNKNINVCNNCGKQGHLFHQCKLPITSYGIILFRSSPIGLQFLMIRRKDSFGYIDFIRGKYTPYNVNQIQKLIDEMSLSEKAKIKEESFENLWKTMWGDAISIQHKSEEFASSKKFHVIKNGVGVALDTDATTLEEYKPNDVKMLEFYKWREKLIYAGLLLVISLIIYYLYDK